MLVAALKGKREFVISQGDEDAGRARLAERPAPAVAPIMQLADPGLNAPPTVRQERQARLANAVGNRFVTITDTDRY